MDGSEVECATPAQSGSGVRVVEVSMNGQQFSASGVAFTYQAALAVSSVWPERGASEGGTLVTVHGSGFSSVSEGLGYLQCRFNGSVVRASLVSSTAVVCNSTEAAAGHVALEVSGNGLDFTSSGVQYEFVTVLVSEVLPWTGPELGGTVVTLAGTGMVDAGLRCRFGSLELVSASVSSGSEVRCVSPMSVQTGWLGVELVSDGESLRLSLIHI